MPLFSLLFLLSLHRRATPRSGGTGHAVVAASRCRSTRQRPGTDAPRRPVRARPRPIRPPASMIINSDEGSGTAAPVWNEPVVL
jgi:hypothetical protein